jgi:hypothetical protein
MGDERGGDTKGQLAALNGGHAVVGMFLANGLVNGIDKGADKRSGFGQNHGLLQAIGVPQGHGKGNDFNLMRRAWHPTIGGKIAGRTVYRGRMGQARYPELGRSTQLPHR